MSLKFSGHPSFADLSAKKRKCKHTFFDQVNKLVDWEAVQKLLSKHYPKGLRLAGRQAYDPILLLKMLLLQTWYGLSDYAVEEEANDRITFSKFCNISMDSSVPDHSVLSRFRTALTKNKAFDKLLSLINTQLEDHGVMVRNGSAVIDASLSPTPRKPKGKKRMILLQMATYLFRLLTKKG